MLSTGICTTILIPSSCVKIRSNTLQKLRPSVYKCNSLIHLFNEIIKARWLLCSSWNHYQESVWCRMCVISARCSWMVIYINLVLSLKFDRLDAFKYSSQDTGCHQESPLIHSPVSFLKTFLAAEQDEKQGMKGEKDVLVTVSAGTVHCYGTGLWV